MEYKDHSHNHLDEGIISGLGKAAGSAARTVGRAAVKSKGMATTAGSAVKTGAAAVTKPVADRVKKGARSFDLSMKQGMGPEGRASARKAGGFLKNQITDPLKKLGQNALMNPRLGDVIQNRTGGFKGATNRMQDAIFGANAMDARRADADARDDANLPPRHWSAGPGAGAPAPTSAPTPVDPVPTDTPPAPSATRPAGARPATGSPTQKPRMRVGSEGGLTPATPAPPPSGEQSSTGGPRPGTRDPRPDTRSPSMAARIGGALKQSMMHDPQDTGRRARTAGAAAGAINRGIGGSSPGRMAGVFDNDANSLRPRADAAFADQAQVRRQARELMQLDTSLTYGQAMAAVMQRIPSPPPPPPKS